MFLPFLYSPSMFILIPFLLSLLCPVFLSLHPGIALLHCCRPLIILHPPLCRFTFLYPLPRFILYPDLFLFHSLLILPPFLFVLALLPAVLTSPLYMYSTSILLYNIFRKLTHQARDCSASQMFVSRQLPTCKMLIRRNVYGFMLNVQKSNNLILNSIVHCDILFTSPLWKHWRLLLYIHPF